MRSGRVLRLYLPRLMEVRHGVIEVARQLMSTFLFSLSDHDFITRNGYMDNGRLPYADESGYSLLNQVLVFKVRLPRGGKPRTGSIAGGFSNAERSPDNSGNTLLMISFLSPSLVDRFE